MEQKQEYRRQLLKASKRLNEVIQQEWEKEDKALVEEEKAEIIASKDLVLLGYEDVEKIEDAVEDKLHKYSPKFMG